MRIGTKLAFGGISATILVGGITLLLTVDTAAASVTGVICVALSFIIPLFFWIGESFLADRAALGVHLEQASGQLTLYTSRLESVAKQLGIRNDARFLPDGFIGLQRQCLVLEEDSQTGPDHVRMAVLGHLPSCMRINDLSEERGRQLYENWEPPHLVGEYVRLVNRRSAALRRFLDSGGIVREVYDKTKLSQYVAKGFTFHDRVHDPTEEILERLRALLHFIDLPNYYVCLVGDDQDRPGPHFLLKQRVGLVVDLRTTETQKHFTNSLDGLYADSSDVLKEFEEKFALSWRSTEKPGLRSYLQELVDELSPRGRPGP